MAGSAGRLYLSAPLPDLPGAGRDPRKALPAVPGGDHQGGLERRAEVRTVSPMVSGSGLALRGEASQSIALMGVALARYDRMVDLRGKLVDGAAVERTPEEIAADILPTPEPSLFERNRADIDFLAMMTGVSL